jgi:hypothetical protein
MLVNAKGIHGYTITANDGRLGTVSDLLFDDASWLVRWLVVDTGKWLPARKVLLPVFVLGHLDPERRECSVRLNMHEVKDSPDIDTERPVSRQMETNIYNYYGWSPYWGAGYYAGGFGYMGVGMPPSPSSQASRRAEEIANAQHGNDDPHLRSIGEVTGYHIHASDGEIGHVEDFLVQDADWSIHYLVVDTRNWWPGNKVLISPRSAQAINWASKLVSLNVDRQKVKESPTYDPSTTVDRAYERHFHNYYGTFWQGDRP